MPVTPKGSPTKHVQKETDVERMANLQNFR